jgi:HD-like signal output (HDOD) protein
MHHHPIPDPALAEAILGLLIDDHRGLWHLAELDRALTPSSATEPTTRAEDTVESLYAAGLVHRSGDFVFASRAAHVCRALPA